MLKCVHRVTMKKRNKSETENDPRCNQTIKIIATPQPNWGYNEKLECDYEIEK